MPGTRRSDQNRASGSGQRRSIVERHDDNAVLVGKAEEVGLVDEDRAAGFDGQQLAAGGGHRFERPDADRGHVEPHVLLRLGDFDHGEATRPAQACRRGECTRRCLRWLRRQWPFDP